MRYSLGILKPDCVRRGLVDVALGLVQNYGLRVIFKKKTLLESKDAEFLYSRCAEADFFKPLVKFMTSGEVLIYIVEIDGDDCAIKILNEATGHTDPSVARSGTIRKLGLSVRENLAHSTMNEETFWSELVYFLTEKEVGELKLES